MGNRYRLSVDISAENRNVTGSLTHVSVHRKEGDIHFLVDCGIYYPENKTEEETERNKNYDSFAFKPENLDFVLLTHVHADHCGRIPLLYKRGFYHKVYCTPDTSALLSYALYDGAKVMAINAKRDNKAPLYDTNHVDKALLEVVPEEFEETFEPCQGVKVTFFKNAHLIGAAIILVQIESEGNEDINLMFLGDYHKQNIFFDVPELPSWVKRLPLHVVTEATYGKVDSKDTNIPVFCNNIERWIQEGKKTIIIPSLSLGRFQQLAYVLKQMQEKGTLDRNIPIWFDGNLGIKYCNLFEHTLHISPEMRYFMPYNSSFVTDREALINFNRREQKIIVATSGNANYGPVPEYISAYVEATNAAIHFTSFLIPGCLGNRLLNTEHGKMVSVHSVMKRKMADVKTTQEFSGHAKRDEIVEFLSKLENIRSIHITHGEVDAKESFAEYCREQLGIKDIAIAGMGYTMRVDRYRIVKSVREKEYFG